MTDREKFISNVTASLGRSTVLVPSDESGTDSTAIFEDAATAKSHADRAMSYASERSTELIDRMANMAAVNGWKVHRAGNPEDAADLIADISEQKGAKSVLRSTHEVLTQIGVDSAVTNTGATLGVTEHSGSIDANKIEQAKSDAFTADIGITGVDYAIAETGTVVLHPRNGLSRLVSLAPPTHIAVLRPNEVLDSLTELFAMERNDYLSGDLAGSMNLISGPSKTADIEGTTVTGIHGPLEVHLIILENR
jgi:L-lactate dehydrogenase complex protein LldG